MAKFYLGTVLFLAMVFVAGNLGMYFTLNMAIDKAVTDYSKTHVCFDRPDPGDHCAYFLSGEVPAYAKKMCASQKSSKNGTRIF